MKALLATFIGMAAASAAFGQNILTTGYIDFSNVSTWADGAANLLVDISGSIGEGATGDFFGSDYSVSLYYSLTPISGKVDPFSLTLYPGTTTPFFGTTGSGPDHGPFVDGAGLFGGPEVVNFPGTSDGQIIYIETAVWYSGSGATSYANALELGDYAGYTSSVAIRLDSGTDPDVSDAQVAALEINLVPEPSTIALGALGGAALLLFRRRK